MRWSRPLSSGNTNRPPENPSSKSRLNSVPKDLRMVFSVVGRQRHGIPSQGISSVAKKCLCGLQNFCAGNSVVLLSGGCASIPAISGKGKLVGGCRCSARPDPDDFLTHHGNLVS